MESDKFGIIGAGGQARETLSYAKSKDLAFVAIDKEYIQNPKEIDVLEPTDEQLGTSVIAAVGAPALKKKMVESWKGDSFISVISDEAYIDETTKKGQGCIIAPRAVITTHVEIGDHVLVNVAATISHDCTIGNYSTISPGAHIGGKVKIGDGVFIGIGSVISNDVKIANGVVVGAGAVLVSDADTENGVYVGVPAKLIKVNDGWMSEI